MGSSSALRTTSVRGAQEQGVTWAWAALWARYVFRLRFAGIEIASFQVLHSMREGNFGYFHLPFLTLTVSNTIMDKEGPGLCREMLPAEKGAFL